MVIDLPKLVRSDIFFLSVTALMCFVLDHLLCPALAGAVVVNERRHCWQMKAVGNLHGNVKRVDEKTLKAMGSIATRSWPRSKPRNLMLQGEAVEGSSGFDDLELQWIKILTYRVMPP